MELEFRKGALIVDKLRTHEPLEQLRAVDVRSVDKNSLIDLNQVTIDETKPVPERVAEFIPVSYTHLTLPTILRV